jgi:hypothetical protein
MNILLRGMSNSRDGASATSSMGRSMARGAMISACLFRPCSTYLIDFLVFVDVFIMAYGDLHQGAIGAKIRHHSRFGPLLAGET